MGACGWHSWCITRCDACVQVAVLFRSHNDLLGEFTYFLPDNTPPSNVSCLRTALPVLKCTSLMQRACAAHVQLVNGHAWRCA